jgi:hypothetical protein
MIYSAQVRLFHIALLQLNVSWPVNKDAAPSVVGSQVTLGESELRRNVTVTLFLSYVTA